jgi:transposase-like protein
VFRGLKKAILERALGAELTHHLGYEKDQAKPEGQANQRNGSSLSRAFQISPVVAIEFSPPGS